MKVLPNSKAARFALLLTAALILPATLGPGLAMTPAGKHEPNQSSIFVTIATKHAQKTSSQYPKCDKELSWCLKQCKKTPKDNDCQSICHSNDDWCHICGGTPC